MGICIQEITLVCEASVFVFGHSTVSFWPLSVCQSELFNFLVWVVVGRVISVRFLPVSTQFLLWRLNCCNNLSAIVMASFRSYEWDFIGFFARCMRFPRASALILFHSSGGYALFLESALVVESRMDFWYSLLSSDGVVITFRV